MIDVTLYEFKKRENSTLRPDTSVTQKTHSCQLKEKTSLLNPVLIFDFGKKGNPAYYNYCYIEELGNRYYFINDWSYDRGIWIAECSVDVLASWKISIGNSTQYVTRSSYTYNGGVVDNAYPAIQPPTVEVVSANSPWTTNLNNGTYVISVINNDDGGIGSAHYYSMTQNQMNDFMSYMLGDSSYLGITEISEELSKALLNPAQYVTSCVWYPFSLSGGTSVSGVKFGWWVSDTSGKELSDTIHYETLDFTLPKHPQAASRGVYLNKAPYSYYTLYFPGVGTISLDSAQMTADTLTVSCAVDMVANQARLSLTCGNIISVQYAQLGVPIQLTQLSQASNLSNIASGVGGLVKNAMTGNVAGLISSGFNLIGSAVQVAAPEPTTIGSNGSVVSLAYRPQLKCVFYQLVSEDNADLGRPLCQAKVISSVPGYIEVLHADVALTGTATENQRIKSYMESGFFYE